MPPKRRKLSLDESECDDRETKWLNAMSVSTADSECEDAPELWVEPPDKDKRYKTKAVTESSADAKMKDDTPKPTRISERLIIKRNRLEDEEAENQNQAQIQSQTQTPPRKQKAPARQTSKQPVGGKKNKRTPRAQWSIGDKNLFFLGLGEFGKNFEAISNKISHGARLKGLPLKDKMQVRYFYYRCWAKISKFIERKDKDIKMRTQELYGLINYGVLKKYIKETNPQFGPCLNELIDSGETTYTRTYKGKKTRIWKVSTPVCTYLKKINRIEDKRACEPAASYKLPYHITLELTPKNHKAWGKVQAMSQNPRVRVKVTANRTLESVFNYLDKKWRPHRVRLKERLGATEESNEELVCHLHPSCKITPITIIPHEKQKIDITLKHYRENILPTLQKKKKSRTSKEADKTLSENNSKAPGTTGNSTSGTVSMEQKDSTGSADQLDSSANPDQNLNDTKDPPPALANLLAAAASDIASYCGSDIASIGLSGGQNVLADAPVGPKPPTVLLEDENAMFPDSSPFSPSSSASIVTSTKPTVIPTSPTSSSTLSSLPSSSSVISPSVNRKKSKSRKTSVSEEGEGPSGNCDNNCNDSSTSPSKSDGFTSIQDLKDESEKEIIRMTALASEGFTQQTSNTVTLLHLSLMLGRKSVIRMEYEWREKTPTKTKRELPPLLSQAASQMSNVLRRLCNLATVELTNFSKTPFADQKLNKNVPCSQCGREGSVKSGPGRKRQTQAEKRESTREIATMTDTIKLDPNSMTQVQVFHPTSVISQSGRTFVAGPPPGTVQLNGPDPVFRVPFVPSFKTVLSKEEQIKLEEQQRVQQQAKEIMQQAPSPRNRLLKKRTLNSRSRKAPPIIVQRTLLPKVDSQQVVAYIQQPGSPAVTRPMVVGVSPDNLMKIAQPVISVVPNMTQSKEQTRGTSSKQSSDILAMGAQSSEIPADTAKSQEKLGSLKISSSAEDIKSAGADALPPLFSMATTSASVLTTCPISENISSSISTHADTSNISISDLDISMSSVTGSSMGPDAGDKFLDMVLQNSEQGFSGLICSPKKSSQGLDPGQSQVADTTANFDSSILRTPPHAGISSSFVRTPTHIFTSPLKLGIPDQSWINSETGDVSLSAILGDSSNFKQNNSKSPEKPSPPLLQPPSSTSSCNYASLFDTATSDIPDTGGMAFSKGSVVSDISLSSLLGDPSFKRDDSQSQGISPPDRSVTTGASNSGSQRDGGLLSGVISAEGPPPLFNEASQDSFVKLDVDGIVNESSLDLMSKFESLAAHITGRQDIEPVTVGDKQEKLLGGSAGVSQIVRIESSSTAS